MLPCAQGCTPAINMPTIFPVASVAISHSGCHSVAEDHVKEELLSSQSKFTHCILTVMLLWQSLWNDIVTLQAGRSQRAAEPA